MKIQELLFIIILFSFVPVLTIFLNETRKLSLHYFFIQRGYRLNKEHHLPMLFFTILSLIFFLVFFTIKANDFQFAYYLIIQILAIIVGFSVSNVFILKHYAIRDFAKYKNNLVFYFVPKLIEKPKEYIKFIETKSIPQQSKTHEITKLQCIDFKIKDEIINKANEIFNLLCDNKILDGTFENFQKFLNGEDLNGGKKIMVNQTINSNKEVIIFMNTFLSIPINEQYKQLVTNNVMSQDEFNQTFLYYLDKYFKRDITEGKGKKTTFISMKGQNLFNNVFKGLKDKERLKYDDMFKSI
jgi:hypothetical protein